VPYRGSAQARTDLIGGQVDSFFDLIAPMKPQVTAGHIKVLATTGAKRSNLMPGVPTVIEAGVPDYTAEAWNALLAPANTPDDVVEKIRAEVIAFQKTEEAARIAETQGMISTITTPKELADFMRSEVDRWAAIIKAANLVN
jgi:tripartite-type tricarboxylate transporter receptor subunit TctC